MSCRDFIEFLWKYLDDRLSGPQRAEFDAHLAICPSCVNYLQGYRETIRLAVESAAEPDPEIPVRAPAELLRAVLAARALDEQ